MLAAATIAVTYLLVGPSPPRRITLATGQPDGMYDQFGRQYRERLGGVGLKTSIVRSTGSVDNLQRLARGDVDVAFVQGGTAAQVPGVERRVHGIAAVYLEPLWVFHRGGSSVDSLSAFAGRRVSVGLPGSGTEAVATALLQEHGVDPAAAGVLRLSNVEAQRQLISGALYGAFFVTSYRDPLVFGLLEQSGIDLLSFRRAAAYARKFPGLTPVALHEGLLDLRRNLPKEDKTLLAPAALLACRSDLHPRVVEQILKVAQAIHGAGSLMDPPSRFPTFEGLDLPVHEAAQVYLTQGESFLSRTLPYPLLRWTLILRVLLLPLILWIPLVRVLPEVSEWQANRRFSRLYTSLRDTERALVRAGTSDELKAGLSALERLSQEAELACDKVRGARQRDVYHWRVHLAFVRSEAVARLARMETGGPSIGS